MNVPFTTTCTAIWAAMLLAGPASAGDPAAGKLVFNSQCAMCHTISAGGANLLGPNLHGVVGRTAGTLKGFGYSPAMKAAGFVWTSDKLTAYLPAPGAMVPGTKMAYAGLRPAKKVDDLVAFLETQK
jgi:cytochrome c